MKFLIQCVEIGWDYLFQIIKSGIDILNRLFTPLWMIYVFVFVFIFAVYMGMEE